MKTGIPKSLQIIETEFTVKSILENHLKVTTYCYEKYATKFFSCKEKAKMIILTQSTTTTGDELGLLLTVTLGGLGKTYNDYQLLITSWCQIINYITNPNEILIN